MLTEFSIIEGEYLRDLLDQPRALEDTLAGLEELEKLRELAARLRGGEFKTVGLTGMGSWAHRFMAFIRCGWNSSIMDLQWSWPRPPNWSTT